MDRECKYVMTEETIRHHYRIKKLEYYQVMVLGFYNYNGNCSREDALFFARKGLLYYQSMLNFQSKKRGIK